MPDLGQVDGVAVERPVGVEDQTPALTADGAVDGDEGAAIEHQTGRITPQQRRIEIDTVVFLADLRHHSPSNRVLPDAEPRRRWVQQDVRARQHKRGPGADSLPGVLTNLESDTSQPRQLEDLRAQRDHGAIRASEIDPSTARPGLVVAVLVLDIAGSEVLLRD